MNDSFGARSTLQVGPTSHRIASLKALAEAGHDLGRLPYSIRILLENLLRHEDGRVVGKDDIEGVLAWDPEATPSVEIAFTPGRVLLQDFTGVPAVVDLAAMRDAMVALDGNPELINPGQPAELVIDHSVQVDAFGSDDALRQNTEREFERNRERYMFLRWGQQAFDNFQVVPPSTGIVHQVNLEYLARVVMTDAQGYAFPDTLVGTDSHTTMINGVGVLGWGVGGIEAEAAMLGQPISMLVPQVVGFRLEGRLPEGATATDLVLRVVEMLRELGVVGKFVEFFGPGLADLPVADRATIANMAPEYGATCGIFPVDALTLDYLRLSGRSEEQVRLVEAVMRAQGLFHDESTPDATYTATLELDLETVEPSLAGPKRPQDRIPLSDMKRSFVDVLPSLVGGGGKAAKRGAAGGSDSAVAVAEPVSSEGVPIEMDGETLTLNHGSVVIAAITSCTNTSNPSVMLAAGLVAQKAVARGMQVPKWVKTSLAPGSQVVTRYLRQSGLLEPLESLGFHVVGYGCTTCIGNSGPLPEVVQQGIEEGRLAVASVLSGNRNFEGRVHQAVRANYLASPPLVVAYALAGRVDFDPASQPLGLDAEGEKVFLKDVWPSQREIQAVVASTIRREMFIESYDDVFTGPAEWRELEVPSGAVYEWDDESTYVRRAPYFDGMSAEPDAVEDIEGARCLALLGDSVTTDHISPAGAIKADSPAGRYLQEHGVEPRDFNSYGSRRGNHEVMVRGTFANVRLRNQLVPGVEGGETSHQPDGEPMSIYAAAMRYADEDVPLVILAGSEYGTGSSRDWAAKGPKLLGVRAVIAQSFERIHRSNLIGMGIAPLEFLEGESAHDHGLTGEEEFSIEGLSDGVADGFRSKRTVTVSAKRKGGFGVRFQARVRIDTPQEVEYFRHGGILCYVLRRLAGKS